MINKTENPVLRVNIESEEEFHLTGISFDLMDYHEEDIESIGLYYMGKNVHFSEETPVGQPATPAATIEFEEDISLNKGNNHFWLSLKVNEEANLEHEFSATLNSVVIGNHEIKYDKQGESTPLLKYGYALRKSNEDGVDTYRIPGLATTNNGTLIAVYDVRWNNGSDLQGDIDVGMSRSFDGGKTWEPMKIIMDKDEWGGLPENQNGVGDPTVLVDRETGTIWVAALWAHGHPNTHFWGASEQGLSSEKTGQLLLTKSEDNGDSWSDLINITEQLKDPDWYLMFNGPGNGITTSNGTLVFPAQYVDSDRVPHSTILWSKDHGSKWNLGTGAKPNTTEAQVIELDDGSLMLNMRDNKINYRSVYTTQNLGESWSKHPTSGEALIGPTCNADILKGEFTVNGSKKSIVLFVNPNSKENRDHMTIKASLDEGMTWPEKYWFLLDEGQGRGYPSMTQINDTTIGVLYEGSQADLVFQKINIDEVIKE
jgi:sialidase-1